MKDGLLILERIVIESISKKEKNIQELSLDTNLEHSILLNILPNLLMKNILKYNRGSYSIDKETSLKWLSSINKEDNLKDEATELFTSLVNQYFKKDLEMQNQKKALLKIQKVWLTKDEEIVFNAHMINLDNFFQNIKKSRKLQPVREKTHEQKVVFWGASQYSDLVHGVLEAV
jgi:hypothetical protein